MFEQIFEELHEVSPCPVALIAQAAIFGEMVACGEVLNRSLVRVFYLHLLRVMPNAINYPWFLLEFSPDEKGCFSGEINS
ncbi:MAG: hypothetical protein WC616_01465 [Candidatus Omnitrophota bacterium]